MGLFMKLNRTWVYLILGCVLLAGYAGGETTGTETGCTDCFGPYSSSEFSSAGITAYSDLADSRIHAINTYNQEHDLDWTAGVTSKSSLTGEQKKRLLGLKPASASSSAVSGHYASSDILTNSDLPSSFDWRSENGDWTTPVRDQGACGSCYAFATTGIYESYWERYNQDATLNPDFSEQYLVSCDSADEGCNGGEFINAMPYFIDQPDLNGGVGTVQEIAYPYAAMESPCKSLTGNTRYTAEQWGFVRIPTDTQGDPEEFIPTIGELKAAIYLKGPLAVGMSVADPFYDYVSGIYEDPVPRNSSDHAVILVGWGIENEKEYFIAKNSWGTGWGESGWFRIAVNSSNIGQGAVYFDYQDAPVPTPTGQPGPYIVSNFTASPVSGTVPLKVSFSDRSEGSPQAWEWSFGDGLRSVDKNPVHTYMKPGKYSVELRVSRGEYQAYSKQADLIRVKPPYQQVFAFPKGDGTDYPQPSDPDDDGLFEDIDGNGWLDFNDPKVLFDWMNYAIANQPVYQFDFDGSGFIGFDDVSVLKSMV